MLYVTRNVHNILFTAIHWDLRLIDVERNSNVQCLKPTIISWQMFALSLLHSLMSLESCGAVHARVVQLMNFWRSVKVTTIMPVKQFRYFPLVVGSTLSLSCYTFWRTVWCLQSCYEAQPLGDCMYSPVRGPNSRTESSSRGSMLK